jgi:predicted S18 family serine protease
VGKFVVMLAVAMGAATAANAGIAYRDFGNTRMYVHQGSSNGGMSSSSTSSTTTSPTTTSPSTTGPSAAATPEIDPAGMLSGLTLLLGGLAVLRGRRKLS